MKIIRNTIAIIVCNSLVATAYLLALVSYLFRRRETVRQSTINVIRSLFEIRSFIKFVHESF